MHDVHPARDGAGRERTLPVNLLLKERCCLVVGAGNVAHRKIRNLLAHGARVVAVAPEIADGLRSLAAAGRIGWEEAAYDPSRLDGDRPFLVFAATDDDALNRRVVADAAARGILATSASSWREGDFLCPAVVLWGEGQVSVTTEGASCRQARFMRERLEPLFGAKRDYLLLGREIRRSTRAACEHRQPEEARSREWVATLRHLVALEELVVLAGDDRVLLFAWAPRDAGLEAAALRLLGAPPDGTEGGDGVQIVRGEARVAAAAAREGPRFLAAFEVARREGLAGVHLERLAASLRPAGACHA